MIPERTLVLASASPRRPALLGGVGIDVVVRPARGVDETVLDGEEPREYVLRVTEDKARAEAHPGETVLAADTTVVDPDGAILGKPEDDADAARMLRRLAGEWHRVLTAVAVHRLGEPLLADVCETEVRFATMQDDDVAWYVATGEPRDKAGAYGIQGRGALFVEEIRGNYSNVVGLPLPTTLRLLRRAGLDPLNLRI